MGGRTERGTGSGCSGPPARPRAPGTRSGASCETTYGAAAPLRMARARALSLDVYAFGRLLRYLLTGVPPHKTMMQA